MSSISFKDYAEHTVAAPFLQWWERYELHKRSVPVDGAGGIPAAIGPHIVRRKAVFRDHDLAALFEWAADQLVIATPGAIVGFLRAEKYLVSALPVKLRSAHGRWLGLADNITSVRQWHDAIEPEEMVFLLPEPWQVRS